MESNFDKLIYYARESRLEIEEVVDKAKDLFPDFNNKDDYNDKHLPYSVIESYRYKRGLGLPIIDVAHAINISVTLLRELYKGKGLSLETLVNFAEAETFGIAEMKAEHMEMLEKLSTVKHPTTFLEKAYSNTYGDRTLIDVNAGFGEAIDTNKWDIQVTKVENKPKSANEEI